MKTKLRTNYVDQRTGQSYDIRAEWILNSAECRLVIDAHHERDQRTNQE